MRALFAVVLTAFFAGGIPIDSHAQENPFAEMPAVTDGCTTEKQMTDFAETKAGHPLPVIEFTSWAANNFIHAANKLFAATGTEHIPPLIVDAAFMIPYPGGQVSVSFLRKGCSGPLLVTTLKHFQMIVSLMPDAPQ